MSMLYESNILYTLSEFLYIQYIKYTFNIYIVHTFICIQYKFRFKLFAINIVTSSHRKVHAANVAWIEERQNVILFVDTGLGN